MPTFRQLEYLVALAETRHFRKASERCNTTQPTLSEQIKALEDRLGAQLVERNRSGALLTPIGSPVAQIGRRILSDVSGPMFQAVIEIETDDLASWEQKRRVLFREPEFQTWFAQLRSQVEAGAHEFYRVEA